jgi:hypothetical protein
MMFVNRTAKIMLYPRLTLTGFTVRLRKTAPSLIRSHGYVIRVAAHHKILGNKAPRGLKSLFLLMHPLLATF